MALALASCGEHSGSASTDPASGPATASRSPVGIVPTAGDAAGSGVPGPGAGVTAVGGLAGGQDSGGATAASSGAPPAPTGGDGAASATMK